MLVYPNYNKCIVNIIASIKKYYRIPTNVPTLPKLDNELNKMYKNVVLIVLCGVGKTMLENALSPSDALMKNMTDTVTSVFPSLPSAAEVSCQTGLCPGEHGRLGQTMFFKELCRTVELSSNLDPYSEQPVSVGNAADFLIPFENFFGEIADSIIGGVQPFSIAMPGVKIAENKSYHKVADNPKRMFELIKKISETDQNTFTYVQWNAPKDIAQKYGCGSEEMRTVLKDISDTVGGLAKSLDDTVFIVTSSHGMVDISEEIMMNLLYDLCDCLVMPPNFGRRAINFFVKYDRRSDFEAIFDRELSQDFMLMSRSEILRRELFGNRKYISKVYDFLGDYCAFAISDKSLRFRALNEKHRTSDKASYGGITTEEMLLPLAVLTTKRSSLWKKPFFEKITPGSFDASV